MKKARTEAEPWVQSLRTLIGDSLGMNWQIKKSFKGKVVIRIKTEDGSWFEENLLIDWQRDNTEKIRSAVEEIHHLVIDKKVSLDKAVGRLREKQFSHVKVPSRPNAKLLLNAWEGYEFFKVKLTGDVTQETWNTEYGGETNFEISPQRQADGGQGKTYLRLKDAADSANSHELLVDIVQGLEAGTRARQIRVQHIASFLKWATSSQSGSLLPSDSWTPPPKFSLSQYIGRKSKEKQKQASAPAVALEEKDLLELISSIPIDIDTTEKKHRLRDRAMEWDLAIKLSIVYGLRPIEVSHAYLEVKKNDKEYLFCTYCKKAGAGITKPRRLFPLHPEWEEKWQLLERVMRKDPLPRMKAGAGDAFKNYLRFNDVWKKLKEQKGAVPYSFRHSYSKRAHQVYKLSDREVSAFMGHTVPVHNSIYCQWSQGSIL
tara:strand:- start:317 stop:1606 length:1290 start_codon:yes stop_codon:yes gene_type:complete